MLPVNTALADHAVVVSGGRIVAVGPSVGINARFEPRERVVRPDHALMPGFVNAHARGATCLLRGVTPAGAAEARWVSPDFVKDGTRVAIAEMLQAGITCFATLDLFPEEAARVAAAAHVRAAIGLPVGDEPTAWASGATEHLAKAEQLWDTYRSNPWITFYFAPPTADAVSNATLSRLRRVADELDARVAMPVHESPLRAQSREGHRPLHRLRALGLLRPGFSALHMTQLDESDFEVVARTGLCVVACPQSDLRRGAGSCPVARLDSDGVTVGLGTNGPIGAAALDVLAEARAAALLAGPDDATPSGLGAGAVLRMATLGGAIALGLSSHIGSIEAGKAADLVCFDLGGLAFQPCGQPADAIVFAATRAQATDVWTSGRAAVNAGVSLAFDEQETSALVRQWAGRIGGEFA